MIFLKFAWRYFWGKKSTRAIQIISWISVLAMAVSTAALILVLSVFNGFEYFIKDMYGTFYPDIKITAINSKYFTIDSHKLGAIKKLKNIQFASLSLEQKVLMVYDQNQTVVTLKGIDNYYDSVTHFSKHVQYGEYKDVLTTELPSVILGLGISNKLGVNENTHLPVMCYSFSNNKNKYLDLSSQYQEMLMQVNALFVMQEEIDYKYAFTSIENVQSFMNEENVYSSIEIKLNNINQMDECKKELAKILDTQVLSIQNKYEQNKTLFFVLKSERWIVFAILLFMMIIASFNIIGALSMLVIEKKKDIAILSVMGMNKMSIRKIFIFTGLVISLSGACIGAILAYIICILQIQFGLVKMGDTNAFLVENYPVKIIFSDFIVVMFSVMIISIIASWLPAVRVSSKTISLRNM